MNPGEMVVEGFRLFGPIFVKLVGWIIDGVDPIEAMSRERVEDIVPLPLHSRLAYDARMAAEAMLELHGGHPHIALAAVADTVRVS